MTRATSFLDLPGGDSLDWSDLAAASPQGAGGLLGGLLDEMPLLLAVLDCDGRLLKANAPWLQFAKDNGYYVEPDCRGVDYIAFCRQHLERCAEGTVNAGEGLAQVVAGAQDSFRTEYPCPFIDGRWNGFMARRLDPSLVPSCFLVIHFDVTALVHSRLDAMRAKAEAEKAAAIKLNFLGSVSHELRTPLNAIHAYAEMMEREILGPLGSDRYRTYAGTILKAADHLLGLVEGLLDLRRLEEADFELNFSQQDLSALVREVVEMLEPQARAEGVALSIGPFHVKTALLDGQAMRQILINLVNNAIRHGGTGTSVTLSTEKSKAGGFVLTIEDDGPGIGSATIARASEPFRHSQAHTAHKGGLGIGLPLSKRLMQLHGGDLLIDSAPGRGTWLRLQFPERVLMRE